MTIRQRRRDREEVRWAVVGIGTIGVDHAERVARTPRARLAALCSRNPAKASIAKRLGCAFFTDHRELLRAGVCDAILIATPHDSHVPIAVDAIRAGAHVLLEKPVAVDVAAARRLVALARRRADLVAGVMFQMRTEPAPQRIARLLRDGALGDVQRATWIVTDWFRPDAYYNAVSWRGTWAGEGGGVLVNQCPHQLDLLGWWFGAPQRITAVAGFGRRHPIEVEDEVAAILEYERGFTATFLTSTGEAPGERRLEIAGTRGFLVWESDALRLRRNLTPSDRYARSCRTCFTKPPWRERTVPLPAPAMQPHEAVIRNFVDAILDGAGLVAPLAEATLQVEMSAAMLWSAVARRPIPLPVEAAGFGRCHRALVRRAAR